MLDTLITNATILTQDPTRPTAHSVGILNGRIIALDDAAVGLTSSTTNKLDAHGKTLLPGFNDAHAHSVWFGQTLSEVNLGDIASCEDLYNRLADNIPSAQGKWILASNFSQVSIDKQMLDIARLDAVSQGHPLLIKHNTGHSYTVNTRALKLAGIDPNNPPLVDGGEFVTDAHGRATGTVDENAMRYIQDVLHPESGEFIINALDRATAHYLTEGLTSVTDAGVAGGWIGHSPREFAHYQTAREQGKLRTRMQPMITIDCLHSIAGHAEDPEIIGLDAGIHTGLGDDWLRVGPTKMFVDGAMLGATAAMTHNYCHHPETKGYFQGDAETMRAQVIAAAAGGWSVALHAIGDAAIDFAIEAIGAATTLFGRPRTPHRLEHCSVVRPDQLPLLAKHHIVPVPQPRFIFELGDAVRAALGPERALLSYPGRRLADAGLILPGSSDRPVVNGSPLKGIESYVTRLTESGFLYDDNGADALTIAQALYAYTAGSAAATGQAGVKGQVMPGQLADFALADANPLHVSPTELGSIPIAATIIDGEVVFGDL